MVILDTDFIVAVIRDDRDAIEKIRDIEAAASTGSISTTTINAFELFDGAFRSRGTDKGRKELEFVRELLNSMENVFDFDYEASEIAGKIMAEMQDRGTPLDLADVMIAAIAIRNGEPLVSRNLKHFSRIEGLALQKW